MTTAADLVASTALDPVMAALAARHGPPGRRPPASGRGCARWCPGRTPPDAVLAPGPEALRAAGPSGAKRAFLVFTPRRPDVWPVGGHGLPEPAARALEG